MTFHLFYPVGFAILTLLAFACRLILLLSNHEAFRTLTIGEQAYAMIWGLRFDAAIAAPLAFAAFLAGYWGFLKTSRSKLVTRAFLLGLALLSVLQISDVLYFEESGRHVSYEIRDLDSGVVSLISQAVHMDVLVLSLGVLVAGGMACALALAFRSLSKRVGTARSRGRQVASLAGMALFTVVMVRGGIRGIPQNPLHVYSIGNAKQALIASNGAYNIVHILLSGRRGARRQKIPGAREPAEKIAGELYPQTGRDPSREPSGYNLILVFLEGWPASYMRSYGFDKDVTPVFDGLRTRGLTSSLMLAGGHRTTEGLFATLCSYPNPLGQTVARTQLEANEYRCLPEILRERGYYTLFVQGSHKDTSGTGVFAQKLGFQDSIGKEELPRGRYEHNSWGAHDSDLYDYLLRISPSLPQPFLVAVNTNSTHDERLPNGVAGKFPSGVEKQGRLNILNYADRALGEFVEAYGKDAALRKNTIFVLVADHTHAVSGGNLRHYAVPFAMFGGGIAARHVNRATSQRDIAPTILDALGMESPRHFSGKSLSGDGEKPYFADYYHVSVLGWIEGETLVEINVFDGSTNCFDWRSDPDQAAPRRCGGGEERLIQDALGFAEYSQKLLFEGRVRSFRDFDASREE
ncbi:MAG: hypothetical protein A2Z40_05120 [Deltaproteobacteria bacterium RBG_19FT_COMBO_60_16]|nr:MAG: hypothetical protein A2Z40_05120 [Deltaproteobacteria bacterium RBG_19FT_COMBO_60_16]